MSKPVIIDCDPSADDAIALMLALASPELAVVGITTVSGVTTARCCAMNACKILTLCGRTNLPVIQGAAQPLCRSLVFDDLFCGSDGLSNTGLAEPSCEPVAISAVEHTKKMLQAYPEELSIISTAPMTNLAHLAQACGGKPAGLRSIITASGNYGVYRDPKKVNPRCSWNMRVDPEAAAVVFDSGVTVEAVGLDISLRLTNHMTDTLLSQADPHSPKTAFFRKAIDFNRSRGLEPYSLLVDALAVAYAIDPTLAAMAQGQVKVDTKSILAPGNTLFETASDGTGTVLAAYDFAFDRFLSLLQARIFS